MTTNIYISLLVCFFSYQVSIAQSKNKVDPKINKPTRFENTIINGPVIVDNSGVVNINIQNNQIFVVNLDDDVEKKIKLANTYTYYRENSIKSEIISIPNKVIDFNDISTNKLNDDSLGLFSPATIENSLVYWQKELQTLTQKVQAQDKESNLVDTHANLLLLEAEQAVKLYEYVVEQKFETFEIKDPNTGQIEFGVKLNDLNQDPNCLFFDEFINGFARVKRNNKYGFFNQDFECVINLKFDYAENFVNGNALVKNLGNWYFIDTTGAVSVTLPSNLKTFEKLGSDTLVYIFTTDKNNKYYLDYKSKRISKEYLSISQLRNSNFYVVKSIENYKYGVIDIDGLERLSTKYDDVNYFNDTIVEFTVNSEHQKGLINLNNGFQIFDSKNYQIEKILKDFIIVSNLDMKDNKKKLGFLDKSFSWKLSCSCDELTLVGNNLFRCYSDRRSEYNLYNSSGIKLYQDCGYVSFENNYSVLRSKKESFIIDENGKIVIRVKRWYLTNFDEFGIARIKKSNNKVQLINKNSQILNPILLDYFDRFNGEGQAIVGKTNELGIIRFGVIDTSGNVIVPIEFDPGITRNKSTSLYQVSKNDKLGLFDEKRGKLVLDCIYDRLDIYCEKIFSARIDFMLQAFYFFDEESRNLMKVTDFENWDKDGWNCYKIKELNRATYLINNSILIDFKNNKIISHVFSMLDRNGMIVTKTAIFDSNLVKIFDTGNDYHWTETISVGDNCTYRILKNFNEVGYIDCKGLKITDFHYSNKSEIFINGTAVVEKYKYGQEKGCNLGVIDLNGLEFIPPIFESIVRVGDDFKCTYKNLEFIVTINGRCISNNKSDYDKLIKSYYKE